MIAQRVPSRRLDEVGPINYWVDRKETEIMQFIVGPDGTVYGRAAILPTADGILTAGGLRVQTISHLLGIVTGGEAETAARDRGRFTAPPDAFAKWASEQGTLLEGAAVDDWQKKRRARR